MRVLDLPLLQLDGDPQTVDAAGDKREQGPFDPLTEKAAARAVESEPAAVDHGVLGLPAVDTAECPGGVDAE